jgi:hypothetical protein
MFSFKQFLLEMPYVLSYYDKESHQLDNKKVHKKGFNLIGSSETHNFYRSKLEKIPKNHKQHVEFIAADKKTKRIHLKAAGEYIPHSRKFTINDLKGHPKTTIKAHEFYHYLLINGSVKKLVSDYTQSKGGQKVWHKLTQQPHINMSAEKNNKSRKYNPDFESNYTSGSILDNPSNFKKKRFKRLVAKVDYK